MARLIHSDVRVKGTKTHSHLKSDIYALEFLMSHHVSRVCDHWDPPVQPVQELGCRGLGGGGPARRYRIRCVNSRVYHALLCANRDTSGDKMAHLFL